MWNHLYKRDFILKNNIEFAPTIRCEDHIFSIGAKLLAQKVDYLNDYLYFYRKRTGSAVNSRNNNNFCIFDNINLVKKFIIRNNLWNDLKKEFEKYQIKVMFWHYHQTPLKRLQEYKNTCKAILGEKKFKKLIKLIEGKKLLSIKKRRLNGKKYKIDRIISAERRASPVGGCGMRYACMIQGKRLNLYLEKDRWFIESTKP